MIFSRESWFFKVYCWSKKLDWCDVSGVNLCPFMRTVFIWAPIKFVFYRGYIWKIPVASIVWPSLLIALPMWAGMVSFDFKIRIYVLYVILTGIALGITAVLFLTWIFSKDGLGFGPKCRTVLVKPFKSKTCTETAKLIGAYISSIHDKICPYIEFK